MRPNAFLHVTGLLTAFSLLRRLQQGMLGNEICKHRWCPGLRCAELSDLLAGYSYHTTGRLQQKRPSLPKFKSRTANYGSTRQAAQDRQC